MWAWASLDERSVNRYMLLGSIEISRIANRRKVVPNAGVGVVCSKLKRQNALFGVET